MQTAKAHAGDLPYSQKTALMPLFAVPHQSSLTLCQPLQPATRTNASLGEDTHKRLGG